MARRADINVVDVLAAHWNGTGTIYIVQTTSGVLYMVYVDSQSDVSFKKSSDGGLTWSTAVTVSGAYTVTNLAVWYDRWSAIASDYICVAFTESGIDDTFFRTINTASSDALSTLTTVFAGSSTAAGGHLSVVRAKGGNTYIKTVIDAGAEGGFYRLPVANFPSGAWDAARTVDEAIATLDQMILLPDLTASDTNDIMAIFQDASVTETSRKLYDDSANSWAEASINAAITELSTATAFANFATAVDLTNNLIVLLVWTNTDTLNADLLCYTVTNSSITAKTDVVTNSTDDQGLCAISIDSQTGWWYAFYGGKSDGSETWNTALNIYMKVSKDSGANWGPETKVNTMSAFTLRHLYACPWLYKGPWIAAWYVDGSQTDDLKISVEMVEPRATYQLGV
jgi:hypothetical protein